MLISLDTRSPVSNGPEVLQRNLGFTAGGLLVFVAFPDHTWLPLAGREVFVLCCTAILALAGLLFTTNAFTFNPRPLVPLAAFLAFCCSSFLWSPSPSDTLLAALLLTVATLAAVGLGVASTIDQLQRSLLWPIAIFVAAGLAYELITSHPNPMPGALTSARARGLTIHPNLFGRAAGLGIILLFVHHSGDRRVQRLVALPLLLSGLIWSESRTAVIAVAATLAVALVQRVRSPIFTAACAAAVAASLFVVPRSSSASQILSRTDAAEISSLTDRVPLWAEGLGQLPQSIGWGSGYFSSHLYLQDSFDRLDVSYRSLNVHNSWLEMLLTVGVVGTGLFMLTLLVSWRQNKDRRLMAPIFTYVFVLSLTESVIGRSSNLFVLALAVAVGQGCRTAKDAQSERRYLKGGMVHGRALPKETPRTGSRNVPAAPRGDS